MPKAVRLEFVTPVPRDEFEITAVLFILYVLPDAKFQDSDDDQPVPVYQFIDLSAVPRRVIPPPSAVTSDGVTTEPNSIFLSSTVKVTEFIVVVVPFIVKSPATYKLPPIPTPPVTIKAPEVEFVDAVELVIAKPDTFNISVDGLNDMVESLETAEPEDDEDGVNKIEWKTLAFPALFTTTFCAVLPDAADEAVIGTQLKTPAAVDCNTELPVAGLVAGNVYTVLPVADETKAV